MAEINPPTYMQTASLPAVNDRLMIQALLGGSFGVAQDNGLNDLLVTQRGAGANMSVDVAAGGVFMRDTTSGYRGRYYGFNDGTVNKTIAAADATNPRRDLIVATVKDASYGVAGNVWAIEVVTGTPAASPSDPTLTAYQFPLARVAVAAAASSITNANITDLRVRAAGLGGFIVCTSTTRPTVGLVNGVTTIYETDTGLVLVYYGATTGWRPPWGQPWGRVAPPTLPASFNFTSAGQNSNNFGTWSQVKDRRYRITINGEFTLPGVSASYAVVNLHTSGGATVVSGLFRQTSNGTDGGVTSQSGTVEYSATSTGTVTWRFNAASTTGSTWSFIGTRINIDDVGPAVTTPPTS